MPSLNKVANKPLVILNLAQDPNAETRGIDAVQAMSDFLAKQKAAQFLIVDMRNLAFSFDSLMKNMNVVSREHPIFGHPMLRETLIVTADPVITRAVKGLNSPAFGNLELKVFPTMDDATDYIDSQLVAK